MEIVPFVSEIAYLNPFPTMLRPSGCEDVLFVHAGLVHEFLQQPALIDQDQR